MIGQRVSHYRLAERLGKGGSSTVYKAHDLDDERMVAVKVFRPTGQDPKISIQSFVREARAISKIHHPNVVEIYADDTTLRKKITPVLRRHMEVDTGLDAEVRSKIKNLQEGTAAFEVEYAKVMDQIKHKRGLE